MRNATRILAFFLLTLVILMPAEAAPLSTAFTYQGNLKQGGMPLNATADFIFYLWDAASAGTQVAGPVAVNGVTLNNGVFTSQIDFGSNIFNGEARWLEIAVRTPAGSGTYTLLFPRQPLTAVPYALQTRGLFVDNTGKVGIGNSAPTAKLDVRDGDLTVGAAGQQWLFHSRSSFGGDFLHITDNDGGVPQFQRGLVIHQNGRVGIGTSAPGEKLTVAGSMELGSGWSDYQHLRMGGGNSSGYVYGSFPMFGDGIHLGYNYYADAAGVGQVINPGGGTSRVSVGPGFVHLAADDLPQQPNGGLYVRGGWSRFYGSVGIGIDPSGFLFQVNGSAAKPGGGSWTNSSDIRLKKNVEPLQGALNQLMSLHGVTFEYIDPAAIGELSGQRIGMIAQDVETVFPDWVGERKDGFKTLTYRGFEALTVEALRDLRTEKDAQIEVLRAQKDAEIATLAARVSSLEHSLQTLISSQNGGAR